MALLYFTGFDRSDKLADYGVTNQNGTPTITATGRFGSKGLQVNFGDAWFAAFQFSLPQPNEVYFSLPFRCSRLDNYIGIIHFLDTAGGAAQIGVTLQGPSLTLRVSGIVGTVLATCPTPIVRDGRWYLLEGHFKISNTVGIAEAKLNGVQWASLSNIDTQVSSNAWVDGFQLGGGQGTAEYSYDDLHIADTTGTKNNSWLGDRRVDTIRPNGAGDSAQGTASTGGSSSSTTIDETGTPNTTDYNTLVTVGNKDLFAMSDLSAGGTIHAVKPVATALKTDAGTCDLSTLIKSGATEAESGQTALGLSNAPVEGDIYGVNPATASDFTEAEVNAIQVGYKRVA